MSPFEEFAGELASAAPPDSRLLFCQFRGDPNDVEKQNWRAKVFRPDLIDDEANVYFCVSAMRRNERGEFRRRRENFAAGLCMMVDDLGSGLGAKFPLTLIAPLPPTGLIETSPDNFQAVYIFEEAIADVGVFDALIRGFIAKAFIGSDPGMAGVNRVFRPPVGVNGKPKYRDASGRAWRVRLADFAPLNRYPVECVAEAFGVDLTPAPSPVVVPVSQGAAVHRVEYFLAVYDWFQRRQALLAKRVDVGGWIDVLCPWQDEHSGRGKTGAALRRPAPENAWWGSFRCWHGHCEGRGIRDVAELMNRQNEAELEATNRNADAEDFFYDGPKG